MTLDEYHEAVRALRLRGIVFPDLTYIYDERAAAKQRRERANDPTDDCLDESTMTSAGGTVTPEQINKIFTYHSPNQSQQDRYVALRNKAKEFALLINDYCPESREKSLALTDLQRCVQMANAAIAITEAGQP
jgi:hypothetical protein